MVRRSTALALLALAGCAMAPEGRPPGRPVTTTRAVHLARVRCLLVAPFENASDDPLAAEAATGAYVSGIDGTRTSIYPISELRALFKDTSLELPEGVSPSLALELGELIGADAALYGAIEGRSRGEDAELTLTLRLAATGARDLLFSKVVELRPSPDQPLADQVRKAILEASAPMMERLGVPGRKVCFDRQRTDRLRLMALAGEQRSAYPPGRPVTAALPPAPPPEPSTVASTVKPEGSAAPLPTPPPPEPPQVAEIGDIEILAPLKTPRSGQPVKVESAADLPEPPAPPSEPEAGAAPATAPEPAASAPPEKEPRPQKGAKKPEKKKVAVAEATEAAAPKRTLTVRQADWLTRLQKGGRVLLGEVAFDGRSAQFAREGGLKDVAALLAVAPNLKLRVEGFVDATNDVDGDLRLSMEMARAVGRKLIELGVARDRLTWAGRGGDAPMLPNFTARGRMANRRVEVVAGE
jgi:outer membrane protein OmpA-like peptidoglycan-associated protein